MVYNDKYLEWVKECKISGLTRTQSEFAQWLFDNYTAINQIGNIGHIFVSVRNFIKYGNPPENKMSLLTKIEEPIIVGKIDLTKIDSSTKPKKETESKHYYCCYCKEIIHRMNFTYEHLIPLSMGGNNSFYNKKPCCSGCNRDRGNKFLEKWLLDIENDLKNGHRKAKWEAISESIPYWIGYMKKHEIKMLKKTKNNVLNKTSTESVYS